MINNRKSRINKVGNSYEVVVPSKKNYFIIAFCIVWLSGWAFGLVATSSFGPMSSDEPGIPMFMLVWTIGWIVAGMAVIFFVIWGLFGKEKLIIDSSSTLLEKSVFGIGLKRNLETSEIKDFRYTQIHTGYSNRLSFFGLGPGKVQFDYGFKTYSLGLGLDDAEAKHLVSELSDISNSFK